MSEQEGFDSQEHTRWAKQRALEVLETGDLTQAIDSIVADLAKDPTRSSEQKRMILEMGLIMRNDPAIDEQKVRAFIEGFN